jgi:hypothetical protein
MDKVKIKFWVATNSVGSKCHNDFEIEREIWEGMSPEQQEAFMFECVQDMFEWNYEVVEE